ncbi:MAG: hypothetical protein AB7N65_12925 [Vicinamibacterales bacterium]
MTTDPRARTPRVHPRPSARGPAPTPFSGSLWYVLGTILCLVGTAAILFYMAR